MGWRPAGGLFEEAGVALEEVDVEEEVERQGAKVEKGCEQAPVLSSRSSSQHHQHRLTFSRGQRRIGRGPVLLTCPFSNTER